MLTRTGDSTTVDVLLVLGPYSVLAALWTTHELSIETVHIAIVEPAYTPSPQKNVHLFYFLNNSVKN